MNSPAIALGASLAICLSAWAAPTTAAHPFQEWSLASDDMSSNDEESNRSTSRKDKDSNCPPDWMRETNASGAQIGTGQPADVLPIGCYENSFDRGPPIGFRRLRSQKRDATD